MIIDQKEVETEKTEEVIFHQIQTVGVLHNAIIIQVRTSRNISSVKFQQCFSSTIYLE